MCPVLKALMPTLTICSIGVWAIFAWELDVGFDSYFWHEGIVSDRNLYD